MAKALTLRVLTDRHEAALEDLQRSVRHTTTRSKAIWTAIEEHPRLTTQVTELEDQVSLLKRALKGIVDAQSSVADSRRSLAEAVDAAGALDLDAPRHRPRWG